MQADAEGFLCISEPLHLLLKLLVLANRFYVQVSYRGDVEVRLHLRGMNNQRLVFIRDEFLHFDPNLYRSYEDEVTGKQLVAAENLGLGVDETLCSVISQVCWVFWQHPDAFPETRLAHHITRIVQQMGLR